MLKNILNRLTGKPSNHAEQEIEDIVPKVVEALGNLTNIASVDACITRLRVKLKDNDLLDKAKLKKLGAADTVKVGDSIQIIFGKQSAPLRDEINLLLSSK